MTCKEGAKLLVWHDWIEGKVKISGPIKYPYKFIWIIWNLIGNASYNNKNATLIKLLFSLKVFEDWVLTLGKAG